MATKKKSKKCSNIITIDQLMDSLGLGSYEDMSERISESMMDDPYPDRYEDEDDDDYDERVMKAQDESQRDAFNSYMNALESTAEHFYGQHKLRVTIPTKMMGRGKNRQEVRMLDKIAIEPAETWNDAAHEIMETINGVGQFFFRNTKEFLDSGPYTACEAVMEHLGYIRWYSDVYGPPVPARMFEGNLRYKTVSTPLKSVKTKLLR